MKVVCGMVLICCPFLHNLFVVHLFTPRVLSVIVVMVIPESPKRAIVDDQSLSHASTSLASLLQWRFAMVSFVCVFLCVFRVQI